MFKSGSIIKLYSYQLPRGSRSDVTLDLWRDLNHYMYDLPLPIIVYEKRDYRSNTPDKPLLGNRTRITIDNNNNVETTVDFNIPANSPFGEVDIQAIIFNNEVEHKEFIKNKSIIFTQNGQVHGFEGQSFISQELGFSLLKKHMLIHVDCTKIRTSFRQDLFMSNRTHLKEGPKTELLKDAVKEKLKNNKTLRRLNNERKNSILKNSDNNKEQLTEMLSKLPVDKDVLNLLRKDGSLDFLKLNGHKRNPVKKEEQKKLNRFPSIFNIRNSKKGKVLKTIPLNSNGKVDIETDVNDDYLFRPYEKGTLKIEVLQKRNKTDIEIDTPNNTPNEVTDILTVEREGPNNGAIRLLIKPTEKAKIGDELKIRATLSNPGNDLTCIFDVKVDKEISPHTKKEPKKTETFPSLPIPQKAFEKPDNDKGTAWSDLGWDGHDIVKIIINNEEDTKELLVEAIVINMDAFVLKQFISKNRVNSENSLKLITDKYFLSIYLHSLFLYSILQKMMKNDEKHKGVDVDDFVSSMIKPYANFLLYENFHINEMMFDE